MGDRGNIVLNYGFGQPKIYLYGHWSRWRIGQSLRESLTRGQSRWGDDQYLARVIFDDFINGDRGLTGFGISPYQGDGDLTAEVFFAEDKVRLLDQTYTFREFIALDSTELSEDDEEDDD